MLGTTPSTKLTYIWARVRCAVRSVRSLPASVVGLPSYQLRFGVCVRGLAHTMVRRIAITDKFLTLGMAGYGLTAVAKHQTFPGRKKHGPEKNKFYPGIRPHKPKSPSRGRHLEVNHATCMPFILLVVLATLLIASYSRGRLQTCRASVLQSGG